MSVLIADIDATCAALGYNDGENYHAEPDAIQGLKHLIWILRRDLDNHEYRRHLGQSKVLQTDLVPMLQTYIDDDEYSDVLIRLLVILTNPTLLLYREGIPKDNHGRKIYLELIDILQGYKEGFTSNYIWASLGKRLHKVLDCDWSLRSEEQGLLIERILVLVRNVLQVPANPEIECRADNDASLHDQIIWALHQSGMLDLILYVLSSSDENQYHLHALEILCLLYREQTAASLADASLQRSAIEKQRDEKELIAARRREKQKLIAHPPPGRHSRFGGTYVIQNVKSISDKDIICHQSLERAVAIDLDIEKTKQKRNFRLVKEENNSERRSAFSVRLCLREYCIEVLRSAYNTLVRQVRRVLERNSNSGTHDDSYLLWAIRFFMEFNRLSGLQLHLVSESLSVQCFHWVLTRMQNHMDMITSDKKQSRLWARRLHVASQTFRELLLSLLALQKLKDDKAYSLFDMLLNNVCYVLEYRETILHLLMNYNESHSTKAFLRDVVETANIFMKMMEKFCKNSVVVQEKRKVKKKSSTKQKTTKNKMKITNSEDKNENNSEILENKWAGLSTEIAVLLANDITSIPDDEIPIPFDAASDINIDDQKEDCVLRILSNLRDEKYEHAILLMRSAREVWPENDCFGSITAAPEDELMLLREIYLSNLETDDKQITEEDDIDDNLEQYNEEDEYGDEQDEPSIIERDLRFEDIAKRLVNPKIVRACTLVLSDWEKIPTKSLVATVTILYRIAFGCSCPAMLFQIALFRIFQRVLNAPREAHHEELRRLSIYVIRKFIEIAPKNPKIYAELLFYKSVREANEIETGYVENYSVGAKGAWSEEQENELQMLFEENQNNPQTDQDVIDWILDNLIDKTRTRRGVLKKLKELGLLFKAPTKKSSAADANKNLWKHDEDEQLKSLYDEFRVENNCLERILQVFGEKRSKQNIIKRMIQLHLIADKSEILPPKKSRKSNKIHRPASGESSDSDSDDENENEENLVNNDIFGIQQRTLRKKKMSDKKKPKPTKRKVLKTPLDVGIIRTLLTNIDDKYKDAIDWLKESINDAGEDADTALNENSSDEDDGIPLLPLLDIQKDAMEDDEFKKLLLSLGIQPPIQDMETYWRIPAYLTANDLQFRVKIINGDEIRDADMLLNKQDNDNEEIDDDDDDDNNSENDNSVKNDFSSDEGSEVDFLDNLMNKRREKLNNLVYNKSDNEDDYRSPLKLTKKKKQKSTKNKNLDSSSTHFDALYNDADIGGGNKKTDNNKNDNKEKKQKVSSSSKWNINNMVNDGINEPIESTNSDYGMDENSEIIDFDSENLRMRLAELNESEEDNNISDNMDNTIISNKNENTQNNIRRRNFIIDSDSSDDENMTNSNKQASNKKINIEKNINQINVDDSVDENNSISTTNKNQSRIINNTTNCDIEITVRKDENLDSIAVNEGSIKSITNNERGQFDDDDNTEGGNGIVDENEITMKRKRNIIDDSENENDIENHQQRRRRIAVIDDDDDE